MHMRRREPMPSRPNPVVHSAGHTCGWEKAFWRLLIVATFVVIWLVLRLVWLQ